MKSKKKNKKLEYFTLILILLFCTMMTFVTIFAATFTETQENNAVAASKITGNRMYIGMTYNERYSSGQRYTPLKRCIEKIKTDNPGLRSINCLQKPSGDPHYGYYTLTDKITSTDMALAYIVEEGDNAWGGVGDSSYDTYAFSNMKLSRALWYYLYKGGTGFSGLSTPWSPYPPIGYKPGDWDIPATGSYAADLYDDAVNYKNAYNSYSSGASVTVTPSPSATNITSFEVKIEGAYAYAKVEIKYTGVTGQDVTITQGHKTSEDLLVSRTTYTQSCPVPTGATGATVSYEIGAYKYTLEYRGAKNDNKDADPDDYQNLVLLYPKKVWDERTGGTTYTIDNNPKVSLDKYIISAGGVAQSNRDHSPDNSIDASYSHTTYGTNRTTDKYTNPVHIKTGDFVVYEIDVYKENEATGVTDVTVTDEIPEHATFIGAYSDSSCSSSLGLTPSGRTLTNTFDISSYSATNPYKFYVKVKFESFHSGKYQNKATLSIPSMPAGKTNKSTNKQIDGDWIEMLPTKVSLDKYIVKVGSTDISGRDHSPDGNITYPAGVSNSTSTYNTVTAGSAKSDRKVTINSGDKVIYKIDVYNENGSEEVTAIQVRDTFPAGSRCSRIYDASNNTLATPLASDRSYTVNLSGATQSFYVEVEFTNFTANESDHHNIAEITGITSTGGTNGSTNKQIDGDWTRMIAPAVSLDKYIVKVIDDTGITSTPATARDHSEDPDSNPVPPGKTTFNPGGTAYSTGYDKKDNIIEIERNYEVIYQIDVYNEDTDADVNTVSVTDTIPAKATSAQAYTDPACDSSHAIAGASAVGGGTITLTPNMKGVSKYTFYVKVEYGNYCGKAHNEVKIDNIKHNNGNVATNTSSNKQIDGDWVKMKAPAISLDKYIVKVGTDGNYRDPETARDHSTDSDTNAVNDLDPTNPNIKTFASSGPYSRLETDPARTAAGIQYYDKQYYPVTFKTNERVVYQIDVYNEEVDAEFDSITITDTLPANISFGQAFKDYNDLGTACSNIGLAGENINITILPSDMNASGVATFYVVATYGSNFVSPVEHNIAAITKIIADGEEIPLEENPSECKKKDGDYAKMNNISLQKYIVEVDHGAGRSDYEYDNLYERYSWCDANLTTTRQYAGLTNINRIKKEEPRQILEGNDVTYVIYVKNMDENEETNFINIEDYLPHDGDTSYVDITGWAVDDYSDVVKGITHSPSYDAATSKLDSKLGIKLNKIPEGGEVYFNVRVRFNNLIRGTYDVIENYAKTGDAALDIYRTEDHDYVYYKNISLEKYITEVNGTPLASDPVTRTSINNRLNVRGTNSIAEDPDLISNRRAYAGASDPLEDVFKKDNKVKIAAGDIVTYKVVVYNNNKAKDELDVFLDDIVSGTNADRTIESITYTEFQNIPGATPIVRKDAGGNPIENKVPPSGMNTNPIRVPTVAKDSYSEVYIKVKYLRPGEYNNKAELREKTTQFRYRDFDYVYMETSNINVSMEKYITGLTYRDGSYVDIGSERSYKMTNSSFPEINKYVCQENETTGWGTYSDWFKANNPEYTERRRELTYNIVIYNNEVSGSRPAVTGISVTDYLLDTPGYGVDSIGNYIELPASGTYTGGIINVSLDGNPKEYIYDSTNGTLKIEGIDFAAGERSHTVEIKVRVRADANASGVLVNSAELAYPGVENATYRTKDADYVQLLLDVSMQKYITAVNGSTNVKVHGVSKDISYSGEHRRNKFATEIDYRTTYKDAPMDYDNSHNKDLSNGIGEYQNEVNVKQGDTVEYTIPIHNNANYAVNIDKVTIKDTLPIVDGDLDDGEVDTIDEIEVTFEGNTIYRFIKTPTNKLYSRTIEIPASNVRLDANDSDDLLGNDEKQFKMTIKFNNEILDPNDSQYLHNVAELIIEGNRTSFRTKDQDIIALDGGNAVEITMQKYVSKYGAEGVFIDVPGDTRYESFAYNNSNNKKQVTSKSPRTPATATTESMYKYDRPVNVNSGNTVEYTIEVNNIGKKADEEGIDIIDLLDLNGLYWAYLYPDGTDTIGINDYIDTDADIEVYEVNRYGGVRRLSESAGEYSTTLPAAYTGYSGIYIPNIKLDRKETRQYKIRVKFKDVTPSEKLGNFAMITGSNVTGTYRSYDMDFIKLKPADVSLQKYINQIKAPTDANYRKLSIGETGLIDRKDTMWDASANPDIALGVNAKADKIKSTNLVRVLKDTEVEYKIRVYNNSEVYASGITVTDDLVKSTGGIYEDSNYEIIKTEWREYRGNDTPYGSVYAEGNRNWFNDSNGIKIKIPGTPTGEEKASYTEITVRLKFKNPTDTFNIVNTAKVVGSAAYRIIDSDVIYVYPGGISNYDLSLQKYIVKNGDTSLGNDRKNRYAIDKKGEAERQYQTINFDYGANNAKGQHGKFQNGTTLVDGETRDFDSKFYNYYTEKSSLQSSGYTVDERTHVYYGSWSSWSTLYYLSPSTSDILQRQFHHSDLLGNWYRIRTRIKDTKYYMYYYKTVPNYVDRNISSEVVGRAKNDVETDFYKKNQPEVLTGDKATFSIRLYNNNNKYVNSVVLQDLFSATGVQILNDTDNPIQVGIGTNEDTIIMNNISDMGTRFGYDPVTKQFAVYGLDEYEVAIINVTMSFSAINAADKTYANGVYIKTIDTESPETKNTSTLRTADADYVKVTGTNVSLQKYIVSTGELNPSGNGRPLEQLQFEWNVKQARNVIKSGNTEMVNRKNKYAVDFNPYDARDKDERERSDWNNGKHGRKFTMDGLTGLIVIDHEERNISRSNDVAHDEPLLQPHQLKDEYRKYQNPVKIPDGETVTFTIRAYNNSSKSESNIEIVDRLQSGIEGEIQDVRYYIANENSDDTPIPGTAVTLTEDGGTWAGGKVTYAANANATNSTITISELEGNRAVVINVTMKIKLSASTDFTHFIEDNIEVDLLGRNANEYANLAYINKISGGNYRTQDNGYRTIDADYIQFVRDNVSMQKYITGITDYEIDDITGDIVPVNKAVRGAHSNIGGLYRPDDPYYRTNNRAYLRSQFVTHSEKDIYPAAARSELADVRNRNKYVSENGTIEVADMYTNGGNWGHLRTSYDYKLETQYDSGHNFNSTAYELKSGNEMITYTIMVYNNNYTEAHDYVIKDFNEVNMKVDSIYAKEIPLADEVAVYSNSSLDMQYNADPTIPITSKLLKIDELNEEGGVSSLSIPKISGRHFIVININARLELPGDGTKKITIGNYAWVADKKTNLSNYRNIDGDWVSNDCDPRASIDKYVVSVNGNSVANRNNSKTSQADDTDYDSDGNMKKVILNTPVKDFDKYSNRVNIVKGDTVVYRINVRAFGIQKPDQLDVSDILGTQGEITKIDCYATTNYNSDTTRTIWDASKWDDTDHWAPEDYYSGISNIYSEYEINKSSSYVTPNSGFNIRFKKISKYRGIAAGLIAPVGVSKLDSIAVLYVTVKYDGYGVTEGSIFKNTATLNQMSSARVKEVKEDDGSYLLRHKDTDYVEVSPITHDVSLQKYVVKVESENISGRRNGITVTGGNAEGDDRDPARGISKTSYIKKGNPVPIEEDDTVTYKIEVYNNDNTNPAPNDVKIIDTFNTEKATLQEIKLADRYSAELSDATTISEGSGYTIDPSDGSISINVGEVRYNIGKAIFVTVKYEHLDMAVDEGETFVNTARVNLVGNDPTTYRKVDSDYVKPELTPDPNISMQKYITKVERPDGASWTEEYNNRRTREGWKVSNSPAEGDNKKVTSLNAGIYAVNTLKDSEPNIINVRPGDKVTYGIFVYNNDTDTTHRSWDTIIADSLPRYNNGDSAITPLNTMTESRYENLWDFYNDRSYDTRPVSFASEWRSFGYEELGTKVTQEVIIKNTSGSTVQNIPEFYEENAYYHSVTIKPGEVIYIEFTGIVNNIPSSETDNAIKLKNTARICRTIGKVDKTDFRVIDSDYINVLNTQLSVSLQKYIVKVDGYRRATVEGNTIDLNANPRSGYVTHNADDRLGVNYDVTSSIPVVTEHQKKKENVQIIKDSIVEYRISIYNNNSIPTENTITLTDILPYHVIKDETDDTKRTYKNYANLIRSDIEISPGAPNVDIGLVQNATGVDTGKRFFEIKIDPGIPGNGSVDIDVPLQFINEPIEGILENAVAITDTEGIENKAEGIYRTCDSDYVSMTNSEGVSLQKYISSASGTTLDFQRKDWAAWRNHDWGASSIDNYSDYSDEFRGRVNPSDETWLDPAFNEEAIHTTEKLLCEVGPSYNIVSENTVKVSKDSNVTYRIHLYNNEDTTQNVRVMDYLPYYFTGTGYESAVEVVEANLYDGTSGLLIRNIDLSGKIDTAPDGNGKCFLYEHDNLFGHDEVYIEIKVKFVIDEDIWETYHTDPNPLKSILPNRAEIITTNTSEDYRIVDYDFVRVDIVNFVDISLQKYIIKRTDAFETTTDFEDDMTRNGGLAEAGNVDDPVLGVNRVIADPTNPAFEIGSMGNKKENALNAEVGDIITYRIYIYNNSDNDSNLIRVLDRDPYYLDSGNSYTKAGSIITTSAKLSKNGGTPASITPTPVPNCSGITPAYTTQSQDGVLSGNCFEITDLGAGEFAYIDVSYKLDEVNLSSIDSTRLVNNSATIIFTDTYNIATYRTRDYDYVKLKQYKAGLQKYVSAVDGNATFEGVNLASDRKDKQTYSTDSTYKVNNPVTVNRKTALGTNTKVTYTIEVENTGDSEYGAIKANELLDTFTELAANGATSGFNVISYSINGGSNNDISGKTGDYIIENGDTDGGEQLANYLSGTLIEPGATASIELTIEVGEDNISLNLLENNAKLVSIRNRNGVVVPDNDGSDNNTDSDYIQTKDITISGFVWNDIAFNKTGNIYNGLYDSGINIDGVTYEKKLKDIKVELLRNETTVVATAYTDTNGAYTFNSSNITGVANNEKFIKAAQTSTSDKRWQGTYYNYRIRFTYDGVMYTCCLDEDLKPTSVDIGTGNEANYDKNSNAKENYLPSSTERETFNNKFNTIKSDGAYNSSDTKTTDISYSTVNDNGNIPESRYISKDGSGHTLPEFQMTSGTNYITLSESANLETNLKSVGLGLRGRDIFDLELLSDVEEVNVKVNGIEAKYKYANKATIRREDTYKGEDPSTGSDIRQDMANTYQSKVVSGTGMSDTQSDGYEQHIRYSDTDASHTGSPANPWTETGLAIEVTYKITVKNASKTNGKANEIIDYYDSVYNFEEAYWMDSGTQTTLTTNVGGTGTGYKSQKITMPDKNLEQGDFIEIFVVLKMADPNATLKDLDPTTSNYVLPTYNMAEITEYTTMCATGTYAGGHPIQTEFTRGLIDKDSAPGSVEKEQVRTIDTEGTNTATTGGDPTTLKYYFAAGELGELAKLKYEDDTYACPTLYFVIDGNPRTIKGTVFEDNTTLNSDHVRSGNGIFDAGESTIEGVVIELIELENDLDSSEYIPVGDGSNIVYDYVSGYNEVNRYVTTSGSDGTYEFTGFLPGNYIICYNYGDTKETFLCTTNGKSYNGEDYQSTNNNGLNIDDEYWYFRENVDEDTGVRSIEYNEYSVAFDDPEKRKNVVESVAGHEDPSTHEWVNQFSDAKMEILNDVRENNETGDINTYSGLNLVMESTKMYANSQRMLINIELTEIEDESELAYSNVDEDREYEIKNMDFGLALAPKTNVELTKRITEFSIVDSTSADNIIAKGTLNTATNEWTLSDTATGSTLTIPYGDETKYIDIQIEDDKLQGAKLQVKYRIDAKVTVEKDFDASEVTIKEIDGILDFIDNDLSYNENLDGNSSKWSVDTSRDSLNTAHLGDGYIEDRTFSFGGYTLNLSDLIPDPAYKFYYEYLRGLNKGEDPDGDGIGDGSYYYKYNTVVKADTDNKLIKPLSSGWDRSDNQYSTFETITLEKVLSSSNNSLSRVLTEIEDTYEYYNLIEITSVQYDGNNSSTVPAKDLYTGYTFKDALRRADTNRDPYTFEPRQMKSGKVYENTKRTEDPAYTDIYIDPSNPLSEIPTYVYYGDTEVTDAMGNAINYEYVLLPNIQHDTAISGTITIHPPTGATEGIPTSYYVIAIIALCGVITLVVIAKRKTKKK